MAEKDIAYLVVNDGSADATEQVVREIMRGRSDVRLINQDRNRGYAQAQKTGFKIALDEGADIVALLHADGQYAPELLPQLLAPLEAGEADLVQVSRMMRRLDALKGGMPIHRWLGNVFFDWLGKSGVRHENGRVPQWLYVVQPATLGNSALDRLP